MSELYNISILSEVNDENVRVAIISAVTEFIMKDSNLNVTRMRRGKIEAPVWNSIARQNMNF